MIKVLVVDDSAIVRRVLSAELSKAADIEVVGTAIDPYVAREKILALEPDVLTLDLEMPRMGGLAFLAKLMKYRPMPVIVVSSLTPQGSEAALRALELGAVDVVAKPGPAYSVGDISQMLVDRIRAAVAASRALRRQPLASPPPPPVTLEPRSLAGASHRILAIGASTGGTEAIKNVLLGLPADTPGTVIVQHMPANFTTTFAERLNQLCLMEVREARHNDPVVPGVALVAPGNRHMALRRQGDGYVVEVKDGPPVHHQRPSVDVLFHSVAQQAGAQAVGVILTGMGADGARGLLAMHEAGAYTLAQDEDSCVVFGMPKEAIQMGAADKVAPLDQMSRQVLDALARNVAGSLCGAGRVGD
jgi:two-component system, chemotaxis family, protein-glutamate methylesterase/glutaminase